MPDGPAAGPGGQPVPAPGGAQPTRPRGLRRLGLAVVRGRSMAPTLHDGDRLLVRYGARPRPGRVAVVRFSDGVVAVKRLDHRGEDGWWVHRDNPAQGRDSWSAGAVAEEDVLAVVLGRVWPHPGRLPDVAETVSDRPHSP